MQHRIVNSLQIIASILMLKARAVTSEETRQHLQDAHRRVMSVAAVQQHLHASARADTVEIAPYLSKLCESLAESMIGESRPATLTVTADKGWAVSADAVSLGLIVTELVINALKYAFPDPKSAAPSRSPTRSMAPTGSSRCPTMAWDAPRTADRRQRAGWAPAW